MSCDVAARPGQLRDEPGAHWIAAERHDDRDRPRRLLGGSHRLGRRGDDHVDVEAHELGGETGESVGVAVRVSGLEDDVLALEVAEVAQTLAERLRVHGIGRRR
jgi:hypothetical protein